MGGPGSGPPDHPGYIFVLLGNDTNINASTLQAKTEAGFQLIGFWRDYAVFAWGYDHDGGHH